jgi:predicted GNAT family acetyltransferase
MQRLEIVQHGHTGFLNYSVEGDTLRIWHVETPVALRGQGMGGALVREAFAYASEHSLKVQPICGFAASYIARNPDLQTTG